MYRTSSFSEYLEWSMVTVELVGRRLNSVGDEKIYVEWLKSIEIVQYTFD
jgi:hypothetical protein